MKLSILERILIQGLLPQETNYVNFKVLNVLRSELSFSEDEIKNYNIKDNFDVTGKNTITWDDKEEVQKEVNVGEKAWEIIREALVKLDKDKKLTTQTVSLYEKFVLEK